MSGLVAWIVFGCDLCCASPIAFFQEGINHDLRREDERILRRQSRQRCCPA